MDLQLKKLVQKEKKIDLRKVKREEAIKIVNDYLDEERPNFIEDFKKVGLSCDFDLSYSTINPHSQKISQETFLDLVDKGLIKRVEGPVLCGIEFFKLLLCKQNLKMQKERV